MRQKLFVFLALLLAAVLGGASAEAAAPALTARRASIVSISVLAAQGDLPRLRAAMAEGLDRGLTVNEEKELMLQLYAYAGFPRCLNGLQTLASVVDERKAAGIADDMGRAASPVEPSRDRLAVGTANQTALVGRPVEGGVYDFCPDANTFLREHLFCAVFERDVLTWQERELATVAMLAGMGHVNAQLRSHMGVALHNGVTEDELRALTDVAAASAGEAAGANAKAVLADVLAARG